MCSRTRCHAAWNGITVSGGAATTSRSSTSTDVQGVPGATNDSDATRLPGSGASAGASITTEVKVASRSDRRCSATTRPPNRPVAVYASNAMAMALAPRYVGPACHEVPHVRETRPYHRGRGLRTSGPWRRDIGI